LQILENLRIMLLANGLNDLTITYMRMDARPCKEYFGGQRKIAWLVQ